jgi:hypothetical protein
MTGIRGDDGEASLEACAQKRSRVAPYRRRRRGVIAAAQAHLEQNLILMALLHMRYCRPMTLHDICRALFSPLLATLVFVSTVVPAAAQPAAEGNNRPDTAGTGRFPAIKEEVSSLPAHVVYRPRDLAALGAVKLGVVAWGNGGCSDDGASSRLHLLELASHGYLVIASGRILSGPGAPPQEPRPPAQPGQIPPPRTKASDLADAVDWALAENARSGSPLFGRIDPMLVALSGWSCGGLQAIQVARDPRVKTMVLHNTGVLNDGPGAIPGMDVRKDVLTTLHTPTIYILGGPKDIAYLNGMDDFARIAHVPVAVANLPVGHGGTFVEPNGGAAASVAVSWLDWQLRGDLQSGGRFVGEDCGLCRDAQWSLQRKQFPAVAGVH